MKELTVYYCTDLNSKYGELLFYPFGKKAMTVMDVDKEAKFWVLTKTNMPAWLLEVGFMDTINDCRLLLDDDYLFEIAKAIHKYRLKIEIMDI